MSQPPSSQKSSNHQYSIMSSIGFPGGLGAARNRNTTATNNTTTEPSSSSSSFWRHCGSAGAVVNCGSGSVPYPYDRRSSNEDDNDSLVERDGNPQQQQAPPPQRVRNFVDGILSPFWSCVQPNLAACIHPQDEDDTDAAVASFPFHRTSSVTSNASRRPPTRVPVHAIRVESPIPTSATITTTATPNPNDVLCGRGNNSNRHPGNQNFRDLILANKAKYTTLTKKEKMMLARQIVDLIRSQTDPPGRFLAKDATTGAWYDIGLPRSFEKTSQALREKTNNNHHHTNNNNISPTNSTTKSASSSSLLSDGATTTSTGITTTTVATSSNTTGGDEDMMGSSSDIGSDVNICTVQTSKHRNTATHTPSSTEPPAVRIPEHLRNVFRGPPQPPPRQARPQQQQHMYPPPPPPSRPQYAVGRNHHPYPYPPQPPPQLMQHHHRHPMYAHPPPPPPMPYPPPHRRPLPHHGQASATEDGGTSRIHQQTPVRPLVTAAGGDGHSRASHTMVVTPPYQHRNYETPRRSGHTSPPSSSSSIMAAVTSQATADATLLLPSTTPPPPPVSSDVSPSMGYLIPNTTTTANMHNPPENLSPGREQEWKRQRVSNHNHHPPHQAQDQQPSNNNTVWSPSLFSNSDAILQDLKASTPLNDTAFTKNESNTTTTTTSSSVETFRNNNYRHPGGYLTKAMATKLTIRDHPEDEDVTNAVRYHANHHASEPSVPKVTPTLDLSADSAMDGLAALSTAAFLRLDESY